MDACRAGGIQAAGAGGRQLSREGLHWSLGLGLGGRKDRWTVSSKMLRLESDKAIPEDEETHLIKVGGTWWRVVSQATNSKESLCFLNTDKCL